MAAAARVGRSLIGLAAGVAFAWLAATAAAAAAPAAVSLGGGCFPAAPAAGPGVVDPFHIPAPAASQLNADGKILYRQGRWEEARQKYRAAEAADPAFLAPALNVACSFVRQERFGDAVEEVLRLVGRAYLPWSEEVASAADLGALKVRREGQDLNLALNDARRGWAEGLADDLIFVARTRAPLKVGDPTAAGVLVLGPRQEIFAWSARTRRYRQLTSEEGRVLAVARSPDGRRLAYVTAEKLVRARGETPVGVEKASVALRGVAVEELDLRTLSSLGRGPVDGDVTALHILWVGGGFAYRVNRSQVATSYRFNGGALDVSAVARAAHPIVTLTGRGVAPATATPRIPGPCAATARDSHTPAGAPAVVVLPSGKGKDKGAGAAVTLGGAFGAGLAGLPIP